MTLLWALIPHLHRHRLELSFRIHTTFRRILVLVGDGQPTHARRRLLNPAEIAKAANRLQEELS